MLPEQPVAQEFLDEQAKQLRPTGCARFAIDGIALRFHRTLLRLPQARDLGNREPLIPKGLGLDSWPFGKRERAPAAKRGKPAWRWNAHRSFLMTDGINGEQGDVLFRGCQGPAFEILIQEIQERPERRPQMGFHTPLPY